MENLKKINNLYIQRRTWTIIKEELEKEEESLGVLRIKDEN